MSRRTTLLAACLAAIVGLCLPSVPGMAAAAGPPPPNVVFILCDDLGYGDLGCFGQKKIRTPNIDRLAAEGMRFTQHYSGNAVCAPARCVLMTGQHPGHAFIRDNLGVKPEGQYPIPADTVTLAKLFRQQGYVTGGFGKWGLGGPGSSGDPLRQGFDRFYGYNCQSVAHNYYPTYLWDNDRRVPLANPAFSAHQKFPAGADPADPASYARYAGKDYSPDLIWEQARRFVRENRQRPFFLYAPTTVPHLALQVPADSLAEYLARWPDPPYLGDKGYLPHFAPRAAYAAMITRCDREVGWLVDLVKELGLDERTIFVFTSDNGPLDNRYGGTDTDFFQSAGPLRGYKGSLYEGGFREPMIVRWTGHVAAGTTSARVTGFEDWMPTLLELVGAAEAIPRQIDGISFAATLAGRPQPERPFLYREFPDYGGQQLVRIGGWVGVRQHLKPAAKGVKPRMQIELYNLREDVAQQHDVAAAHAEIVGKIERLMRQEHVPSAEFPLPALDR
jgi:arylsulfatase A-like enzyme